MKFDLEKALAGEPVRDLSGNKRYILKHPENGYLVTYAMDNIAVCCSTIWYKNINQDEFSMFEMCEEPRPTVTLTLPAPITYPEENKRCYTIVINDFDAYDGDGSFVSISDWVAELEDGDYDYQTKQRIREGLLFATEEDAQAWLDAMRNSRR